MKWKLKYGDTLAIVLMIAMSFLLGFVLGMGVC